MHSPYTPDLDAPNMANPIEAETFRSFGFGKLSIKTGLGSLRGGIRKSIKSTLKIFFKSPRNIKRMMKGSSEEAIEAAITSPNRAADSLATQSTKLIHTTRGKQLISSSDAWIRKLKSKHPTWKPKDGAIKIDGMEYTDEILAPFYGKDGNVRSTTLSINPEKAGDTGEILVKAGGQTDEQVAAMNKSLKKLEEGYDGNPIKSSMDDLYANNGKGGLGDEAIEQATKDIAAGKPGYEVYSADFVAGLKPKPRLTDLGADDIAKRSRFGKKGKGLAYVGAVFLVGAGLWITNNILTDFASKLWGDDCTREFYQDAFPDASAAEIDVKVEACLDQAAKNIMYLGAAAVGVGGLLALFVLSRIIRKKTR